MAEERRANQGEKPLPSSGWFKEALTREDEIGARARRIAEGLQRSQEVFLATMTPFFGLNEPPPPFPIEVRPLLAEGCINFDNRKIYFSEPRLEDVKDERMIERICYEGREVTYHETGHRLHYERTYYEIGGELSEIRWRHHELVAQLSAIICFDLTDDLEEYRNDMREEWKPYSMSSDTFRPLWEAYEKRGRRAAIETLSQLASIKEPDDPPSQALLRLLDEWLPLD